MKAVPEERHAGMSARPQPPWFADEAEISSLLHEVLDYFDRQPGTERQRAVNLPVERHLSSLARADPLADQTWVLVRELEELGLLAARSARRNPLDPEWQGARLAFPPGCEATIRKWLGWSRPEHAAELWRRAVERYAEAFPQGGQELSARRIVIAGRSPDLSTSVLTPWPGFGTLRIRTRCLLSSSATSRLTAEGSRERALASANIATAL